MPVTGGISGRILCMVFHLLFILSPGILLYILPGYDKILALPPPDWYGKEVYCMESFVAFLVAVAAGVACHYIIKWLDRDHKDNE